MPKKFRSKKKETPPNSSKKNYSNFFEIVPHHQDVNPICYLFFHGKNHNCRFISIRFFLTHILLHNLLQALTKVADLDLVGLRLNNRRGQKQLGFKGECAGWTGGRQVALRTEGSCRCELRGSGANGQKEHAS